MTAKYEYISHAEMNGHYAEIVRQMTLAEFKPDVVIAVMRGGADMGVKLSNYFECPLETLKWQTRSGAEHEDTHLQYLLAEYGTRNILFAEDICDSGRTIEEIKTAIKVSAPAHPDKIKFAVAIENTEAAMDCDFASRLIARSTCTQWFVFPWEEWHKFT